MAMGKNQPLSAYDIVSKRGEHNRHVLVVLVDNEPGVLARVVGLFSGRGYNIESLTVTTVSEDMLTSRINIVTSGTKHIINQIKEHLKRLIPVHDVHDLTVEGEYVAKEVVLVKSTVTGEKRTESIRYAEFFGAKVVDTHHNSFVFQLAGSQDKIEAFIALLADLGEIEIARSGVIAMARGPEILSV